MDAVRPDPHRLLGQVAYLQLGLFEMLSRCAAIAPDVDSKADLSLAAGVALEKHRRLTLEIEQLGGDPTALMEPYTVDLDRFFRTVAGSDWWEALVSAYLVSGLLDDFFARLAANLTSGGERIASVIRADTGRATLVALLQRALSADPRLASRLALWGRRLVGDTLLVTRSAMPGAGEPDGEARIEPIVTDLIAAHTRRMDVLGLTA